ncbi:MULTISPECIES: hypothetical protein [unclassified Massilia]|uniref:hypothetical protein n=1 Tax=unclassified Massilia TaxID=2609279 RepID=UPI000AE19FDF|nr:MULTISPECIES: hypothetical protein [unclassified Massilia]
MNKIAFFPLSFTSSNINRFDSFVDWARPFGSAGINDIHSEEFLQCSPYFEWSSRFFAHGDKTTRSWFLKYEFLRRGRVAFSRTRANSAPTILNPNGLIGGKFLQFAKAYLNVMAYYRQSRTPLKPLVQSLSFLEKSLRSLHNENNDPTRISAKVFEGACALLKEEGFTPGQQYDIAKELEIMAGMLQGGYHSKKFRFSDKGFQLLDRPFAFTSPFPSRPRRRAITLNSSDLDVKTRRMTLEEVGAVGLAYRKSIARNGIHDIKTFMAAIPGLALTTVSMRVSDLLTLQRDALYVANENTERRRIRIGRPKVGVSQDLPIAKKLGKLAEELFSTLLAYSAEAHNALRFYTRTYGDSFAAIRDVYLPEDVQHYFDQPFLSVPDVYAALRLRSSRLGPKQLPARLGKLTTSYFVEQPGDIWQAGGRYLDSTKLAKIADVEIYCVAMHLVSFFPDDVDRNLYVSGSTAEKLIKGAALQKKRNLLKPLFHSGKIAKKHVRSDELKQWLLKDFKVEARYPHWPYTTKERATRVDEALLVWLQTDFDAYASDGEMTRTWWQPVPIPATSINRWINRELGGRPPLLFQQLDVKLNDNTYPSISLHDTRKFHHTQALLAGAHEVFIDELAGRRTGPQSDHYDKRTPREIILRSMETFDPDDDFFVVGPIAEQALSVRLTDRKTFLYENAAPKHVTEIGGCATDWSLDPCKQYGDCLRCDQQLWRKGDERRLPFIHDKLAFAMRMITVAEQRIAKYDEAPRSLVLQLQQFRDDVQRCNLILSTENDDEIPAGAIVTFSAPSGTMTASELITKLAKDDVSYHSLDR